MRSTVCSTTIHHFLLASGVCEHKLGIQRKSELLKSHFNVWIYCFLFYKLISSKEAVIFTLSLNFVLRLFLFLVLNYGLFYCIPYLLLLI